MDLLETLLSLEQSEFQEILKDMPYWIKFVLKTYYEKIQKIKANMASHFLDVIVLPL